MKAKEFQKMNTNLQYKSIKLDNKVISDPENLKPKLRKKYKL
jgi:hypothetical protein